MSFGDKNKYSKPTMYKGVQMRSKLESRVALVLDKMNLKWKYEPKLFLLSSGIYYKPDFYLYELKTWVEAKGIIDKNNYDISETFVKDNNTELLLISDIESVYFSLVNYGGCDKEDDFGVDVDKDVYIGECSDCGSYFFCSNIGSYHCRKCGVHNGDHDIKHTFSGSGIWCKKLNISSINKIGDFFDKVKI